MIAVNSINHDVKKCQLYVALLLQADKLNRRNLFRYCLELILTVKSDESKKSLDFMKCP